MILPPPAADFEWRVTPDGPVLYCRSLGRWAPHLFTARPWRLGADASTGRQPAAWREVAHAMDVDMNGLVRVRQVHGATVFAAARSNLGTSTDADIIVNDCESLAIAIQVADCVPLVLADRSRGVVAAAHAGWRGLAARVPDVVVTAMTRHFGSHPHDLVVAAGPSVGACCYEVGNEVRQSFAEAGFAEAQLSRWFYDVPAVDPSNPPMPRLPATARPGHWFFDGWRSVRDQLERTGVPPDQIFMPALCTASHPAVFCSYRRDGAPAGRMAAVIRPRRRP